MTDHGASKVACVIKKPHEGGGGWKWRRRPEDVEQKVTAGKQKLNGGTAPCTKP